MERLSYVPQSDSRLQADIQSSVNKQEESEESPWIPLIEYWLEVEAVDYCKMPNTLQVLVRSVSSDIRQNRLVDQLWQNI